mgnify:CR=1 FL=1
MLRCGDIIAAALELWQKLTKLPFVEYIVGKICRQSNYKVLRLFPHLPVTNKQFLQSQNHSKYLKAKALALKARLESFYRVFAEFQLFCLVSNQTFSFNISCSVGQVFFMTFSYKVRQNKA